MRLLLSETLEISHLCRTGKSAQQLSGVRRKEQFARAGFQGAAIARISAQ
jgi:hypothetical protein